ncbi:MAG: OmpA family protein, partial [Deltaproteobacteria bacterium]|nr:OmpA family protein [Deltaproteobacteria bacterium]
DGGVGDGGVGDGGFPAGGSVAGGALCSTSSLDEGGAELSWLVLLLLAVFWVRRRGHGLAQRRARARASKLAVLGLGLLLFASSAQAQVEIDRFRPSEVATEGFSVSNAQSLGHMRYSLSLNLDYANDPLVFESVAGDRSSESARLVANQLVAHVGGAIGLFDRLVLYGGLPVNALQSGDRFGGSSTTDGAGLGDFWLGARVRLLGGAEDDDYSLALGATLSLPMAQLIDSQEVYSGDRTVRLLPEVLFDVKLGPVTFATNVGVRLRGQSALGNLVANDDLTFGVGLSVPVMDDRLVAHIEFTGATNLHDMGVREQTALGVLAGAKYQHESGFVAGLAAGPGLSRGYGSPDVRIVGMLGYTTPAPAAVETPPAPPADTDGDGILDTEDACPAQPEDPDGFQDEDGCPDPDNDQDTILDADDQCPLEAEDREGFQDEDGCPDPDNDEDTILDSDDECPNEAEDRDGFQDEDGCPDPDNDQDSVLDPQDACPQTPGTPEHDGCPAEARVDRTTGSIVILQRVEFATNRDRILERSEPVLTAVGSILASNPQILEIRVEGHTDDRGRDRRNMDLSRRRAASVRRWLMEHDIAPERLVAYGCGETYPMETNRTRAGRQNNRRVEFRITDPAPEQEPPLREGCQAAE